MHRLSWLGLGGLKHRSGPRQGATEAATCRDAGAAADVVKTILRIHGQLRKEPDLGPGKTVNALLTELVGVCTRVHDSSVTREARLAPGNPPPTHPPTSSSRDWAPG